MAPLARPSIPLLDSKHTLSAFGIFKNRSSMGPRESVEFGAHTRYLWGRRVMFAGVVKGGLSRGYLLSVINHPL